MTSENQNIFVAQDYWDESYGDVTFAMMPKSDALRLWLEANVSQGHGKSCFEVGCFPGRYLSVLGLMGYHLNGIDLTPRLAELPNWFKSQGFAVGDFYNGDFLSYKTEQTFDLVCSFGFIEHFENWQDNVRAHLQLVKKGGVIVLETPNFAGTIQKFLHKTLDPINTKRHNLKAMDPEQWRALVEAEGFVVEHAGYLGKFDFWHDSAPHNFFQRCGMRFLSLVFPVLKSLPANRKGWSPYSVLIARKK